MFATPKFCSSRTVRAGRRRRPGRPAPLRRQGVRYIHVEVYKDNNPAPGYNRWFREWQLPSEPWVFLVGRDGRIKDRFEGSVSAAELARRCETALLSLTSKGLTRANVSPWRQVPTIQAWP